jgi:hypothetical protein
LVTAATSTAAADQLSIEDLDDLYQFQPRPRRRPPARSGLALIDLDNCRELDARERPAAEAAHLRALPTARMKGVPVRRLMLPRIPAPPEVMRGTQVEPRIHLAPALTNGHAVTSTRSAGDQRHDPVGAASTRRLG